MSDECSHKITLLCLKETYLRHASRKRLTTCDRPPFVHHSNSCKYKRHYVKVRKHVMDHLHVQGMYKDNSLSATAVYNRTKPQRLHMRNQMRWQTGYNRSRLAGKQRDPQRESGLPLFSESLWWLCQNVSQQRSHPINPWHLIYDTSRSNYHFPIKTMMKTRGGSLARGSYKLPPSFPDSYTKCWQS